MRSIKLLERAEKELYNAVDWYEEQQKGLSSKFIKRITATLNTVKNSPFLFPVRTGEDIRFAPVKVFSFIIIYWYDKPTETIFVISIFHTVRPWYVVNAPKVLIIKRKLPKLETKKNEMGRTVYESKL